MKEKKKIVIFFVCIGVLLCGAFILFLLPPDNRDPVTPDPFLSKVVGEYTGPAVTGSHFGESSAYEMGANSDGMPVFKDTGKAFAQVLIDYKQGFDAIEQQYHLQPPSTSCWKSYGIYGWQVVTEDKAVVTQGIIISQFFDIYDNSFKS